MSFQSGVPCILTIKVDFCILLIELTATGLASNASFWEIYIYLLHSISRAYFKLMAMKITFSAIILL